MLIYLYIYEICTCIQNILEIIQPNKEVILHEKVCRKCRIKFFHMRLCFRENRFRIFDVLRFGVHLTLSRCRLLSLIMFVFNIVLDNRKCTIKTRYSSMINFITLQIVRNMIHSVEYTILSNEINFYLGFYKRFLTCVLML